MIKLYNVLAALIIILSIGQVSAQNKKIVPTIYKNADQKKMNAWVDSVFNTLSPEQRIGQLFTIITLGNEVHKTEILNLVKKQHVGGIIFLKGTPLAQANLTNAAQKAANVPLMISIDGEWGLAMRLANTPRFPKNMMLGAIQNDSLLYHYGKEVARQCRVMGIHINYAPDMDVNSNPDNPVIGIRSYGENPELVAKKGIMYAKGLEAGNVMSVTKHFPGHGNTAKDSHYTLPVIEESRERLDEYELVPFKKYINEGLSGVMVGHLNIPVLDSVNQPSSLSKPIITDLLQNELGFSGLIFTDGLAMKGVSDEKDHCVRSLLAGTDILLGPINPVKQFEAVKKAVENKVISQSLIDEKCKKILAYKYILNVTDKSIEINNLSKNLNTTHAEWLNRKLNEKAVTLLRNEQEIIPLKKLDERKIVAVSVGAAAGNTFHKTLKKYGKVPCYSAADAAALNALKSTLSKYNTIIISIHDTKADVSAAIENICKDKESIITFFTVPYRMAAYEAPLKKAAGVVLAYENTILAQEFAAQGIFGGNEIEGRIPVSVRGLYKVGDGIDTKKTRLSYNLPEELGISSDKFIEIEKIVEEGLLGKAYPGCQVLIAKDGVVIYEQAFGTFEYGRDDEEVTDESIYDLASMTKAVATVPAIMKLYDKKKITLNSYLSSYVPALKGTNKSRITVREALLHESRLPAILPYYVYAMDDKSYDGKLFSRRHIAPFTVQVDGTTWARTDYKFKSSMISTIPKDGFIPLAENMYINKSYGDTIVSAIANSTLLKRKRYMYSCLNFILLKELVEKDSKMNLDTFLQTNFYARLGMDRTAYNPLNKFAKEEIVPTEKDDFLRKQVLRGYVHDEGAAFMGGISGNSGLFSDANDIAKLCQMFLNEGSYGDEQYLSKRTCALFTQTRSAISRRGLGFDKPERSTSKSSPCSPSTPLSVYGHTGFTGTCFWLDPDNNMIFIFLSNRVYPTRVSKRLTELAIRPRIQEELYHAIGKNKKSENEKS